MPGFAQVCISARIGRLLGACAILIAATLVPGCNTFQQMSTAKWLDTSWFEESRPVSIVMARWDHRVRITENSANGGMPLPGLAGRVYLFHDKDTVDADGAILVQMFDASEVRPGTPPRKLVSWQFDPENLKRLKREDIAGNGYTLFLPWEEYDPAIKKVQLQVVYYPKNGSPYFASPQVMTLQGDGPPPTVIQRHSSPPVYAGFRVD